MKEYDLVELIKDRDEYAKENVFSGLQGAVMSEKPIDGEWQVIFTDPRTGFDFADVSVKEEDLRIVDDALDKELGDYRVIFEKLVEKHKSLYDRVKITRDKADEGYPLFY